MAEAASVRLAAPSTDPVTVTFIKSSYGVTPPTSSVSADGEVYFICAKACWVWTFVGGKAANAFNSQGDYVPCPAGQSGPYTVAAPYHDSTIEVVPTEVNSSSPPPSSRTAMSLKGTITVSSAVANRNRDERA